MTIDFSGFVVNCWPRIRFLNFRSYTGHCNYVTFKIIQTVKNVTRRASANSFRIRTLKIKKFLKKKKKKTNKNAQNSF